MSHPGTQPAQKSGYTYISARIRGEHYPLRNEKFGINIYFNKLDLVPVDSCDHTHTICPTRECVESWGLGDWQLLLQRTRAGRQLVEALGLTPEDLEILKMDAMPTMRHLPSTKEAK